MSYILHVVNGQAVKQYKLDGAITIGRTADNDIQVAGPTVSARHAIIETEAGSIVIKDLQSTNGILVNGKRIEKSDLSAGDIVTIGTQDLELTDDPMDFMKKTIQIKKSWIPGIYYTSED